jgi:2-methylaconitate cis-trans-isomerase PrpF
MQEIHFRLVKQNAELITAHRIKMPHELKVSNLVDESKGKDRDDGDFYLKGVPAMALQVYLTKDNAKNATSPLGTSHPY